MYEKLIKSRSSPDIIYKVDKIGVSALKRKFQVDAFPLGIKIIIPG